MTRIAEQQYSPTATVKERIALGVACAAALVCFLLGWMWLAAIPIAAALAVVVVQQLRENKDRRAALEQLKRDLPSMTEVERHRAVERFTNRFPAWAARKELDRHLAALSATPDQKV